jgi:anti-sigma regulatory factor (Ser/Thr protein kinase)
MGPRVREARVLEQTVPAAPASVPELRAAVRQVLMRRRWPTPAVERAALAVTEATSNVVLHAYGAGAPVGAPEPVIRLRVQEDHGRAEVWVEDAGTGMTRRAPTSRLGLGLPLIGAVSSGFEVRRSDLGGCCLQMRFTR